MNFNLFNLFKQKGRHKKKDESTLCLVLDSVEKLTSHATKLVFQQPEVPLNYEPGQFLTIIDEVAGKKIRRAYSLCSSPYLNEPPAVVVKRVVGGKMSNHINDHYKPGMQVEVMQPAGSFTTNYEKSQKRELFFIGGGSGITPLFSILKTVLQQEPKSSITLIYGNRDVDSIIFKDELESLERENNQLSVIHILEKNDTGYAQYTGIPNGDLMQKIIKEQGIFNSSEIFICGPPPMMNAFQLGLKTAAIRNENIHIESFEAKISDNGDIDHSKTSEVIINIMGETHQFHLHQSKPILDQVLDLDIDMPYSCKNGTCSTCRCLLKSGEVSTDKAEGLTEGEIADGYVLICVGRPLSDRVELELG